MPSQTHNCDPLRKGIRAFICRKHNNYFNVIKVAISFEAFFTLEKQSLRVKGIPIGCNHPSGTAAAPLRGAYLDTRQGSHAPG